MDGNEVDVELASRVYTFTVPYEFAANFATAIVKVTIGHPSVIAVVTGLALLSIGFGFLEVGPIGNGWWLVAGLVVVLYLCVWRGVYNAHVRAIRAALPAGATLATQFGPTHFWFKTPAGAGTVRYDTYWRMRIKNGIVILFGRRGYGTPYLPVQLFPGDWIAFVTARLAPKR
ncbi:hypothetical protein ACEXQE_06625 [Herbiconiux sp. P17]|uniref:hypothetical protein n=1 Tax=Herbiconiux wuyangfengii TaxID=3342794 RepID=UPI0035BA96E6